MTDDCKLTAKPCYRYHRLALAPLLADTPAEALRTVKNTLSRAEETPFLEFILQQGLGPLWHDLLLKNNIQSLFPPEFTRELRNLTFHAARLHLFQKIALDKINTIFTKKAIAYAVFKGVHTREIIYPDPGLRYACDIDLLVAKAHKIKAITTLVEAGYAFKPVAENISHEATLADDRVSIDLHWDILRPGRTRIDVTDEFLATGKECTGYFALGNEATLFMLLVHPVFTKYSTTPQSTLLHLLDLLYWIRTQKTDWDKLHDYLERGGVKTAAWITATYLEMLTGTALPHSFTGRIKPGPARAWYLRQWLARNLSTRLLDHPVFVQLGFTLPVHDTWTDACRAIKQTLHDKKKAGQNTKDMLQQIDAK